MFVTGTCEGEVVTAEACTVERVSVLGLAGQGVPDLLGQPDGVGVPDDLPDAAQVPNDAPLDDVPPVSTPLDVAPPVVTPPVTTPERP